MVFQQEEYSKILETIMSKCTNLSILNGRHFIYNKNMTILDIQNMFKFIYHQILTIDNKNTSSVIIHTKLINILYHIHDILYQSVIIKPNDKTSKILRKVADESIVGIFGEICTIEMKLINACDNNTTTFNSHLLHKILKLWSHLKLLPDIVLQQCIKWKSSLDHWKSSQISHKYTVTCEKNVTDNQPTISFQLKKTVSNIIPSNLNDISDNDCIITNKSQLDESNVISKQFFNDEHPQFELKPKKEIDLNIVYDNERRLTHLPASLMLSFIAIDDIDIFKPIEDTINNIPNFNKIKNIRPLDDKLKAFYSAIECNDETCDNDGWNLDGIKHFQDTKLKIINSNRKSYFNQLEEKTIKLSDYIANREQINNISDYYIVDSEISLCSDENLSDQSESDDNDDTISDKLLFDITSTDKILEKYSQNAPYIRSKKLLPSVPSDSSTHITEDTKINANNIGHQLLLKMGWTGGSLGKKNDGIVEPIRLQEVRTDSNKFKGIGHNKKTNIDPFEEYRKSMSTNFGKR